jgi:hypothetical protein
VDVSRHPLETYLRELQDICSSGAAVKETFYYGALANLFNEIGKTLKPKVRCILTLKNQGAGLPDGGFFTTDQFQRVSETEPLLGQIPARGAIEVKSTSDEVRRIAAILLLEPELDATYQAVKQSLYTWQASAKA